MSKPVIIKKHLVHSQGIITILQGKEEWRIETTIHDQLHYTTRILRDTYEIHSEFEGHMEVASLVLYIDYLERSEVIE